MKKIKNLLIMATAITIVAASCKGKDSIANDPKAVVVAFFERMSKKDIDGAAKLATKDSKSTMDMMKKAMEMGEKMKDAVKDDKQKDQTEDFKDVVFGETKIDGSNATVSITNKKKEQSFEFPLKKEDGSWKVDFNMGTLMKMGMKEMEKQGKNPFEDSDTSGGGTGDGLKNLDKMINSDTLKDVLNNVQKELKKINPEDLKKIKEVAEKFKQQ